MNKDPRKNASGYMDPTAFAAYKSVKKDERRFHALLHAIFDICELAGFEIDGRIVLKDKKTGRVWR